MHIDCINIFEPNKPIVHVGMSILIYDVVIGMFGEDTCNASSNRSFLNEVEYR